MRDACALAPRAAWSAIGRTVRQARVATPAFVASLTNFRRGIAAARRPRVTADLSTLIQSDHDDLNRLLVAMVASATPVCELSERLDSFRLALAVHAAAEANVMRLLLARHDEPALRAIAELTEAEHLRMQTLAAAMSRSRPGSEQWYADALELRIAALDHATRAELARWTLDDRVVQGRRQILAADYATERFRILTAGSSTPTPSGPRVLG